jgi:RNA polymerase sigma-70 factor (ECF subfamily)
MQGNGEHLDQLLVACARGDREALRALYQATSAHLFGIALRIVRRRDMAEDVMHEAMLQIWQNAARFDPVRGPAKAWMIGVVRFRALDALRGAERNQGSDAVEALASEAVAEAPDPWLATALRRCLEELAPEARRGILLAYVEGYSREEIAERLSAPVGTVKSWLHRGLLALKSCLER